MTTASNWTRGEGIPAAPSFVIAYATWVLGRYAEMGITLPAGNRLQQARNFLREVNAPGELPSSPDERLLVRIIDSTQTCFEHYLIARTLGMGPVESGHARRIQECLSGSDLMIEDKNSLARNTQFEMFVAAFLTLGDVPVAHREPPDLIFLYNELLTGIAVKRVQSLKQLRRRFQEGVRQIEESGLQGFVAVNADVLIRSRTPLHGTPADFGEHFDARMQALAAIDEEFASHPKVLGRFTFGTDALWDFSGARPRLSFRSFRQTVFYNETVAQKAAGERFYTEMDARVEDRMKQLWTLPRLR